MTANRDLKNIIRERQQKTGESYAAARAHVMRERAARLGLEPEDGSTVGESEGAEAAVLRVGQRSARVRIFCEDGEVTFRSGDVWRIVPGHVVEIVFDRRWTFGGDAYASGRIENARIDVAKLGLEPLALEDGMLEDISMEDDPDGDARVGRPPGAPRFSYEFSGIAWGALPGIGDDENPVGDAAELAQQDDRLTARARLMELLGADLRCIDAHAHLGNLAFDRAPERALVHYEMGMRIGELSLPAGFDGLLPWGRLFNRPFLRALHGYALCLWRLARTDEAKCTFERILALNPNDNQGVRFCLEDMRDGLSWKEAQPKEGDDDVRELH
jgi:hypothetical protein